VGKDLSDRITDLTQRDHSLRIGRLILPKGQLTVDEVRHGLDNNLISFPEGLKIEVQEDGSLLVPVAPYWYLTEDFILRDKSVMEQIAIHARASVRPLQDLQPIPKGKLLKPAEFYVGALPVSSGPYAMRIDSDMGNGVRHFESGVFLDGGRSTGLSPRLGNERFRQLEIINDGSSPVSIKDLKIRLYFYKQFDESHKVANMFRKPAPQLERVHDQGFDFFEVMDLANPDTLDTLYSYLAGDTYGLVLTPNGQSPIPKLEMTPRKQPIAVERAIDSNSHNRSLAEDVEARGVYEGLSLTKDQSRMLVLPAIADGSELQRYFDKGIRSFVIKGVGETENIYHTSELYDKLCELEREGAVFVFEMPAGLNETNQSEPSLRQFYKGFWCKPESRERLDQVETVINMYGWHKDFLAEASREQIRDFYTGLIESFGGAEKIAIQHGNGPGLMKVADEEARKLGIFTIGVGIQVEQLGQGNANYEPEAVVEFCTADRLPRQKIMDQNGLFSVINLGGDGTNEEDSIDGCSTKLAEKITAPRIRIDPTTERAMRDGSVQSDHFYQPAADMALRRSHTVSMTINGEKVDISKTPLTLPHMSEILHLENSYEGALKIIQDFVSDPIKYWREAGMSDDYIKLSLQNAVKLWEKFGRKIPRFLESALAEFLPELKI
jgi:hypothetical protein